LESFTPDGTTQRGTITGESGDTATLAMDAGEWYFLLVAVSKAGKWSDPSDAVLAEVQDFQQDIITDALLGFDSSLSDVQLSVNGKNTITNSTADAVSGTPGVSVGDRWQKWTTLAAGGKLLASWRWNGTLWIAEAMDPTYLPLVDIGQGTFGTLDGGRLGANTVTAKQILVSDTTNLHPDPKFSLGLLSMNGWVFDPTLNTGLGAASITAAAGTNYAPMTAQIPVTPLSYLYFAVDVAVTGGTVPEFNLRVYCYDKDGVNTNLGVPLDNNTDRAVDWVNQADGTYQTVDGKFQIPAGTQTIAFRPTFYNQAGTGEKLYITNAKIFRAANGKLIVDGEVSAIKLAAKIALISEIIAGDPAGNNAKMTPTGFKVMAASSDGSAPTQAVSLGTSSNDYLNVTDATGNTVASITMTGDMTATSLSVDAYDGTNGGITVGGTQVQDLLDGKGGDLLAWASRSSDGNFWAGTAVHPYLSLQMDGMIGGRAYMVSTTPIHTTSDTANSDVLVKLHLGPGTRAATTADPVIDQAYSVPASWTTGLRSPITFNRLLTPSSNDSMSLLLSYGVESTGRGKIIANGYRPVMVTVQDMGPALPQTGEDRNGISDAPSGGSTGGETAAPAVRKNYDQTWNATGLRSFMGSGAQYNYAPGAGYMYSGLQYGTSNGDMSSMAVFPSLPLAGATVTGVWVYVYYDFWYQGSGGNAYIGLHGQSGLTGTKPASTYAGFAGSMGWPRGAGRWIKIDSATYPGWAAGTHKGFTLGGSGGGYERYGYAHDPKIRVTWTK